MWRKPASLKMLFIDIGAVLSGVLGVSVVLRALTGSRHARPSVPTSSQQVTKGHSMETSHEEQGGVKVYPAPGHHTPTATSKLRPGWNVPENLHLPEPTYWPAVMALAITLLAWSLVTSFFIAVVGLVLFAVALVGWIGDIHHEHQHH